MPSNSSATTVISTALALIDLVDRMLPVIQGLHLAGDVSVEEQQKVLDAYNALRTKGDAAFSDPAWQISGTGGSPVETPEAVPTPEAEAPPAP